MVLDGFRKDPENVREGFRKDPGRFWEGFRKELEGFMISLGGPRKNWGRAWTGKGAGKFQEGSKKGPRKSRDVSKFREGLGMVL